MSQPSDPVRESDHVRLLEEALAEYAARYGLTERARAALRQPAAAPLKPARVIERAVGFRPFRRLPMFRRG